MKIIFLKLFLACTFKRLDLFSLSVAKSDCQSCYLQFCAFACPKHLMFFFCVFTLNKIQKCSRFSYIARICVLLVQGLQNTVSRLADLSNATQGLQATLNCKQKGI